MRDLIAQTKRLFNRAKTIGEWGFYKKSLTWHYKEIRKAKRSSCRKYCQEIKDSPVSARLMRIMAKQATTGRAR